MGHNTGRRGGHHDGDGDDEGENYLQNLVAGEYYYENLYAGATHDNSGDHMHNTGGHGGHHDGDGEGDEDYLQNLVTLSAYMKELKARANQDGMQELYAGAHHDNDDDHMHNHGRHGGHHDGDGEGDEDYLMNLADAIPAMPESSAARPWTPASWKLWNVLENNGLHHQDRVFAKKYNFEPYMI